jgi:hypothetical protein
MYAAMNRGFRLVIVGICTLLLTGATLLPDNLATARLGNDDANTPSFVQVLGDDHGNSPPKKAFGDDHGNSPPKKAFGDDHGNSPPKIAFGDDHGNNSPRRNGL